MKKYLTMGGGALIAISMFLPFTKVYGVTINGLKMGGVAWFYILCGLGIVAIGYIDKKKLYIASMVVGLLVALLAMKYQSDMKVLKKAPIGIGLWLMFAAGLIALIGSIIAYRSHQKPKEEVVAN